MPEVKVVSFDMEGTLIDHRYSQRIWEEDIPLLYGEAHGLTPEEAKRKVTEEYQSVGEGQPEWYDVGYWWSRFRLPGDWRSLPRERKPYCRVYPDAPEALQRIGARYPIIVSSNTIREFLEVQVECVGYPFSRVVSAPSDYRNVKKSGEFYGRLLSELGIEPRELVHIGDHRRFDYLAPLELGVQAYHLDRAGDAQPGTVGSLGAFADLLL